MDTLELIILSKNGDKAARDKLVEENIRLVWSIVRRFSARGYELEDLFQIGSIGLIKAIDKFDISFNVQFSTYAVPMITGEIKRFIRDDGIIKVSRSLKELCYKVKIIKEEQLYMTGIEPTIEQISEILNVSVEEIVMAGEASIDVESIYKTIYQSEGNSIYLIDKIEDKNCDHNKLIDEIALKEIIDNLSEMEQRIIKMRYFEDKTQMEVARILGISQVQVSRLEKKILLGMREKLT